MVLVAKELSSDKDGTTRLVLFLIEFTEATVKKRQKFVAKAMGGNVLTSASRRLVRK